MNIKTLINHLNEIYNIVSNWQRPVDEELKKYYRSRKYLGSNDRKFISNNLYSIIRNHRLIIHIAEKHFSSLASIDYFDKLFLINYTLCSSQALSGSIGVDNDINVSNYINEIFTDSDTLASLIKEEIGLVSNDLSLKYSFPDWMIEKLTRIIPEQEMENFLASLNMNAPTTIRIADKTFEQIVKKDFEEHSVNLYKHPIAPNAFMVEKRINFNDIDSYKDGYFEVQDAGSQLVTLFVEPCSFDADGNIKILDACAGAGGKSLYISKLIGDKGMVYAYDGDQKRLDAFKRRMRNKRMQDNKLSGQHGINKPATTHGIIKFINSEDELQVLKDKIEVLVLDVPCTSIGTIRRNPDLKWRLKEADVVMYAKKQLEILEIYSSYLKPNGRLTYITCSFFKEENEDVITQFLNKEHRFKLDDKTNFRSEHGIELENNFLRLYPHRHNMDGFTACSFTLLGLHF